MSRWLPWLLVLLVAAAGAVAGYRLAGQRDAEAAARKAAEAEALTAKGQVVVRERAAKDLEAELAALTKGNAELEVALARARKAATRARAVAVARASTGEVTAADEPREPISTQPGEAQPCLLAPGDAAEVRVDEVVLETAEGNRVLVGTASAWRLSPPPATQIAGGPFSAEVTWASAEAQTHAPDGWPTWAVVGTGIAGLVLGVVAAGLAD